MVSRASGEQMLKILVCDTDQEFVKEAERILGSEGHTVVGEVDLCKAARLVLKSTPDVVVLSSEFADDSNADLIMELLQHLKPRPTILLTMRMARFDLARKAWRKGADGSLFKPLLRDQELKTAIAQARSQVVHRMGNAPRCEDEMLETSRRAERRALLR